MTKRFRMIAGPNGSGKSTLTALLRNDYAVNFYTLLNADNIFAEVSKSLSLLSPVPVNQVDLLAYAFASEYDENVKEHFSEKRIFIEGDADDSVKKNGSGGIVEARRKINEEIGKSRKFGIDCAGFAMPDDHSDGTLENLLEGMIPFAHRKVIDCCWRNFEGCARTNGAKFALPLKSMIDVYSKLFNHDANQGMFASCSFKDDSVWDWNTPKLAPLRKFLSVEVIQPR